MTDRPSEAESAPELTRVEVGGRTFPWRPMLAIPSIGKDDGGGHPNPHQRPRHQGDLSLQRIPTIDDRSQNHTGPLATMPTPSLGPGVVDQPSRPLRQKAMVASAISSAGSPRS